MISTLEIHVEETNNCKILKLVDDSVYNPDIPVENAIVEVTVPGYNCSVNFNVTRGFSLILNSKLLDLAPGVKYAELVPLPDGVYKIKYSIKPNKFLLVEYDYLRNCQQKQKYITAVCKLFDNKCKQCGDKFHENLHKLAWIKEVIDAAKYKVEDCDDKEKGLELYNDANLLLKDLNNCSC